jgi:CubicO group peptidase (beta-lactamase class C family)
MYTASFRFTGLFIEMANKNSKLKKVLLLLTACVTGAVIYYAVIALPIVTGYSAKIQCSCYFIGQQNPADIQKNELDFFPVSLTTYSIDTKDSAVTVSLFGLTKRKAIYREGLGCTLINELPEKDVRSLSYSIQDPLQKINDSLTIAKDSLHWPLGSQRGILPDSIQQKLELVAGYAFTEPDPEKKVRTRALLIVYDGRLVYERYAPGFNEHSKLTGWSMAKSVTAALAGILVKDGKLQVNERAAVPEWDDPKDPRHAITLQHLLQQTTGLDFEEDYTGPSEATTMLFKKNDMGKFSASLSLKTKPGEIFSYSSGNTNILSRLIRHTLPANEYYSFPYKRLFHKIGMYESVMEVDGSGTFVGSSFMFATARDWARFGLLYYNDGMWNGERILPEGWVQQTIARAPSNITNQYGYQFWLNAGKPENPSDRTYPDVPADLYFADGFEGQDVFIIPSRKLIIVRLALMRGKYDDNMLLKNILAALPVN